MKHDMRPPSRYRYVPSATTDRVIMPPDDGTSIQQGNSERIEEQWRYLSWARRQSGNRNLNVGANE